MLASTAMTQFLGLGVGDMIKRGDLNGRTDAELVGETRAGSAAAFGELYRRHAVATRRALSDNVHDPERQKDLVQETFTRAFAKLDTLREASQFRQWVFQIARNAAIDDLRTRLAVRHDPIDDTEADLVDRAPGPELQTEVRLLAEAIESGLAALSPRDAAAVSMTVHLGFGPAEIAAALDITQGNAKVVLHRARRRLREALELEQLVVAHGAAAQGTTQCR